MMERLDMDKSGGSLDRFRGVVVRILRSCLAGLCLDRKIVHIVLSLIDRVM